MQVAGCQLALPCPAQQWHQCDSECIFVTLEIHLTTLFSEIFCFGDFFCEWTGQTVDKQTDKRMDMGFNDVPHHYFIPSDTPVLSAST